MNNIRYALSFKGHSRVAIFASGAALQYTKVRGLGRVYFCLKQLNHLGRW
jgi:hypothetical protein